MCARAIAVSLCLIGLVGCGGRLPSNHVPDLGVAERIRTEWVSAVKETGGETAASAAQPTGWAKLRGTFKLSGDLPPRAPLPFTAECGVAGDRARSQDVVVDPSTKGIANIVIIAEEIPAEWVHETAKGDLTTEVAFDQKNCIFSTHVLGLRRSQKLKILNSDSFGHNTKFAPAKNEPFNETIPVGGAAVYQPKNATREPFEVACSMHAWMKGWMIIRDDGYFAVTAPDGTFEIPHLPAGVELTFRVWQENARFLQDVDVQTPAQLSGKRWSKGRFKLTLEPESDVDLQVQIAASAFK